MDEGLLQKLLMMIGMSQKQPAPAPSPMPATGVDEVRPWDSPVLRDPSMAQMPSSMMGGQGMAPTVPGGALTPSDDALLQALLRKRMNQEFARAGNQPIPR